MALHATSTGYRPRPAELEHRRRAWEWSTRGRAAVVLAVLTIQAIPVSAPAQEQQLLPNERAFAFSARGIDERTLEARFVIAEGYYLYRDKLKFTVEPGTVDGMALPPGKPKEDQFFGKVETYRNQVVVRLPLQTAAPGQSVTLSAESQGCADIGVCYPPQIQKVAVALPVAGGRPGMPVDAAPRKPWFN